MFESPLVLLGFLALGIILFFVLKKIEEDLSSQIEKSESLLDDFFSVFVLSLKPWVYFSVIILAGTYTLNLSSGWEAVRDGTILILGTYQGVLILASIGVFLLENVKTSDKHGKKVFGVLSKVLSIIVWLVGVLFLLSNFGINISALLAGFGIGGIAIAFAFQSILKDLFSYFTILLDEPIKEGDIIEVAGREGTVKHIGIKTTRLKTAGGEEIVIANDTVATNDLMNYGKAKNRRVSFVLWFEHSNSQTKLAKLPAQVQKIIEGMPDLKFHSSYIRSITTAGIELRVIYHVKNRQFKLHRQTQNDLNLAIHKLITKEKLKISVADIVANQ